MKAFLASLLAASAFAETYELITTDSEMWTWTDFDDASPAEYTNAGEELTLTTSDDGTDITFCFAPTDAAWAAATNTEIVVGLAWTDGVEYVADDDTATDAVVVLGGYDGSAWAYEVFDDIATA